MITNPPYLLLQNSNYPKSIITSLSNIYICAQYKVDTYHLFIEKGINAIHNSGTIAYITPNTFLENKHTSKLRELIHKNVLLRNVILFYIPVFEDPSVDITVFVAVKYINTINHNNIIHIHEIKNNFNDEVQVYKNYNQLKIKSPEYIFQFDASENEEMFLSKLKISSKNLGDIAKTYFGIQTHDRNKYVSSKKNSNTYKPIIDGGNIFRYYITQPVEFLDFRPKNIKSGGSEEVYKKERIVVRQIGKYPEGSICPKNLLTLNTVYNIYLIKNEYNLKYLLGIINSKLIKYYWMKSFYDNKETFPKIKKMPLESIPIKEATSLGQKSIIDLVDIILPITQSEDYLQNQSKQAKVKEYEKKIDRMVYELYGLTPEEIKTVEGVK